MEPCRCSSGIRHLFTLMIGVDEDGSLGDRGLTIFIELFLYRLSYSCIG